MAFSDRVLHWSPRPISETLIWIYGWFVMLTNRPFVGLFLGSLWLALISAPLATFIQLRKKNLWVSPRRVIFMALFGFGLVAFFLLEHSPGTLFYCPVISAAYLTTLSAITLCFFQVAFRLTEDHRGRLITAFALIVAAASSEVGAFFAVSFAFVSLVFLLLEKLQGGSHERRLVWYLVPAFVGCSLVGLLFLNRAHTQGAIFATGEYHNVWMSLKTATGRLVKEYLTAGQRLSVRGLFFSLSLKACFFVGVRYCWLSSGFKVTRRRSLIILALSIVGTTYLSAAATYYGYGGLTNPWHQEFRQCLIILFVATVALLSSDYQYRNLSLRRCEWIALIAFSLALSLVLPSRVAALIHDYKQYSACIESRNSSWSSGLAKSSTMIWWCPPRGRVVDTMLYVPGVYNLDSKAPGVLDIMHFFRKQHLEIRPWTGAVVGGSGSSGSGG
jgi:hypothetical protein